MVASEQQQNKRLLVWEFPPTCQRAVCKTCILLYLLDIKNKILKIMKKVLIYYSVYLIKLITVLSDQF